MPGLEETELDGKSEAAALQGTMSSSGHCTILGKDFEQQPG